MAPLRKFKVQKIDNKVKENKKLNIDNLTPNNNINPISPIIQNFDNGDLDFNEVNKRMNDYNSCCFDICALRNQCKNICKEFKCENLTYFLTLKQVIIEEKRKIKESEKLIKKLENNM